MCVGVGNEMNVWDDILLQFGDSEQSVIKKPTLTRHMYAFFSPLQT